MDLTCLGLAMASLQDLALVGSPMIASWLTLTCFTLAAPAVWRIAVALGVATVVTSIGLVAAGPVSGGGSRAASAESAQAELSRVLRLIHDTAMNTLGSVARLRSWPRSGF